MLKSFGEPKNSAVVIGGSAGSIPVLSKIISAIPPDFSMPVIICVHRMKTVAEGIKEVFQMNALCEIIEPDDKEPVLPGRIYVAPSNYHMLIGSDYRFSLSTDVAVNYSRPAIDLTFQSAASVYKNRLTGILLTGANKDGAEGLLAVKKAGGVTLVQDPEECSAPFMPLAAIRLLCVEKILSCDQIIDYLLKANRT